MIDPPAFVSQHGSDPAVAIASILAGQRHNTPHYLLLIFRYLPYMPLGGSRLPQDLASFALRYAHCLTHMVHCPALFGRA